MRLVLFISILVIVSCDGTIIKEEKKGIQEENRTFFKERVKIENDSTENFFEVKGLKFYLDTLYSRSKKDGLLYSKIASDTIYSGYLSCINDRFLASRYVSQDSVNDEIVVIERYTFCDTISGNKIRTLLESKSTTPRYTELPIASYIFENNSVYFLFGNVRLKSRINEIRTSYRFMINKTGYLDPQTSSQE